MEVEVEGREDCGIYLRLDQGDNCLEILFVSSGRLFVLLVVAGERKGILGRGVRDSTG